MIKQAVYFAYGANLNKGDMGYRCPGAKPIGAATIKDQRLIFRGVADIEPAPGETVHGGAWIINEKHLASLDRFEGYPHLYGREWIEIELESGEKRQALVYRMTSRTGTARPNRSYLTAIAEGYTDFGLPHSNLVEAVALSMAREEGRQTG